MSLALANTRANQYSNQLIRAFVNREITPAQLVNYVTTAISAGTHIAQGLRNIVSDIEMGAETVGNLYNEARDYLTPNNQLANLQPNEVAISTAGDARPRRFRGEGTITTSGRGTELSTERRNIRRTIDFDNDRQLRLVVS